MKHHIEQIVGAALLHAQRTGAYGQLPPDGWTAAGRLIYAAPELLEACEAMLAVLKSVQSLVNEQADDDGIWFAPERAPEAYLQKAMRRLHRRIESDPDPLNLEADSNTQLISAAHAAIAKATEPQPNSPD